MKGGFVSFRNSKTPSLQRGGFCIYYCHLVLFTFLEVFTMKIYIDGSILSPEYALDKVYVQNLARALKAWDEAPEIILLFEKEWSIPKGEFKSSFQKFGWVSKGFSFDEFMITKTVLSFIESKKMDSVIAFNNICKSLNLHFTVSIPVITRAMYKAFTKSKHPFHNEVIEFINKGASDSDFDVDIHFILCVFSILHMEKDSKFVTHRPEIFKHLRISDLEDRVFFLSDVIGFAYKPGKTKRFHCLSNIIQ